jgi:hypothetical protein
VLSANARRGSTLFLISNLVFYKDTAAARQIYCSAPNLITPTIAKTIRAAMPTTIKNAGRLKTPDLCCLI